MTTVELPLTREVLRLVGEGKLQEALGLHNATVQERFEAAGRGDIINLSDLMASHEELTLALSRRRVTNESRSVGGTYGHLEAGT